MQNTNTPFMMKMQYVTDAQSGVPAYTFLAPDGWEIQHNVVWDYNNVYNPVQLYAHCYNGDGYTVQLHTGYSNRYWATPMGNSGNVPPNDVTDALRYYLQWLRGTNIHFTESTILSSSQQPVPMGMGNSSITTQYGRIRGNYEKNGIRFDEILYGTVTFIYLAQPPDFTGFFYEDLTWEVSNLFLSCASGNRDPEKGVSTAYSIKSSVNMTQQFYDHVQQTMNLFRQKLKQQSEASKESTRIINDTNKEINKIYEDIRQKQTKTNDDNHERFIDYIRDVDRYTDGKGTEYQLPTGYQDAWVSSLGTVVMADTKSPDFNILDTSYETWTKLGRKKY